MSTPNWWGDWRPNLPAHSGNLQPTDLIECTSIVGGQPVNTAITGQQIINAASGGGATWGSITGTLSAQTDLQSALNAKNRLATHILSKPRSQFYYSLALTGNSLNVGTYTQNRIILSAFTPAYDLTIDTFNFEVTTLFLGGLVKIAIYSDLNGVPYAKLLESVDVSTTTTGLKTITGFTFTFTAGTTYWIGAISNNSTAGFRTISSTIWSQAPVIATSSTTQIYTSWSFNNTYASLPTTLTTPTTSNLNTQNLLNIVFRAV